MPLNLILQIHGNIHYSPSYSSIVLFRYRDQGIPSKTQIERSAPSLAKIYLFVLVGKGKRPLKEGSKINEEEVFKIKNIANALQGTNNAVFLSIFSELFIAARYNVSGSA